MRQTAFQHTGHDLTRRRGSDAEALGTRAMNVRLHAIAWIATLVGSSAMAQAPEGSAQPPGTSPHIMLLRNDVTFSERYFRVGSRYWTATCGYAILGNHLSPEVPRSEWAITVDEVMRGDTPIVRVRAVAFQVVSQERNGLVKERPPITALSFTLKGGGEPLIARIAGRRSGVNAINATLETAPAQRLFEAFYDAEPIEISVTYQDGAVEVLEVRNWSESEIAAGFNYLHRCLENLHPAPAGAHYFIYALSSGPGRGAVGPPDGK